MKNYECGTVNEVIERVSRSILRKLAPGSTLSTTNPTSLGPGSNRSRRVGKPATNQLNYGTKQTNSVALSPQANYTDWVTATFWRNLVPANRTRDLWVRSQEL
jgi:hypothetical protein